MENTEARARKMIAGQKLEDLIEQFEMTETIDSEGIYIVRGWLMDELEKRNPEAFDKWIDAYTESPRAYFL